MEQREGREDSFLTGLFEIPGVPLEWMDTAAEASLRLLLSPPIMESSHRVIPMLCAALGLVGWEVMVAAPSWVSLHGVCDGMGLVRELAASQDQRGHTCPIRIALRVYQALSSFNSS